MRKTKIIATLGPSTEDPKILTKLLEQVDVVRINLAHGTWDKRDPENHTDKIKNVQKIAKTIKKPIAILVDLKGNKIRIGDLIKQTIDLKKDAMINIRFTEDTVSQSVDEIVVNASHVFENIENEDVILIDDGLIKLQVNEVDDENQTLACTVQEGGLLSRRKGFEVVDKVITKSGLGEEDKEDLRKLATLNVDWVALSFVNQASDVNQAREVLSSIDNQMRVIAKIERLSALKQLYWIIKASDGVMVARGDLALESGPGELTGFKKQSLIKLLPVKK
ncbi:MAG: hypothetical protein Ct9H300mP4_08480 [Gammaproteobacteria bacterium]|nr:MAG: hypothetical protein Ct9H300mP4_08480 [Gammaproteobacteria bacterium]